VPGDDDSESGLVAAQNSCYPTSTREVQRVRRVAVEVGIAGAAWEVTLAVMTLGEGSACVMATCAPLGEMCMRTNEVVNMYCAIWLARCRPR